MGRLVDGQWVAKGPDPRRRDGEFKRADTQFRNWITSGSNSDFPPESGRYHLYVSHACPWAHRTMIYRALKGLTDAIDHTYVDPLMLENGWAIPDNAGPVSGAKYMHHVYLAADKHYTGQCSVPVLWDKTRHTIVSNESSEIIRMLNSGFVGIAGNEVDFSPVEKRTEIDDINALTYENINNGVYRCGFATSQEAYEAAFERLFDALDKIENILARQRYLVGDEITEADWRLFPTLIRFDAVYYGHFKCNRQRLEEFSNLSNYTRDLYQQPGIAETVYIDKIKLHYYGSHETVNPTRIVPAGPRLDFSTAHDRDRF